MPSFQWFKSLSKKNKKYHDYGYDNLRHQPGAQFTTTPPMLGHQQQNHYHNGQLNHVNNNHQHFASQYNQPPPHSLSHRQHQLNPQQLFMQSIPPPSAHQQMQQQQQQQQQLFQPQQQQIIQPVVSNHQHHSQSPVANTPSLATVGPGSTHSHNPHNQQQQHIMHQQNQNHLHHQHQAQCHQCSPIQQSSQMLPLQASTDNNVQKLQQSPQQAHLVSQAHIPNTNSGQLPLIAAHQHAPVQLQSTPSSVQHQPMPQQHCQMQQTNFQCSNSYTNNQMNGYSTMQSQQVPMSPPQAVTSPQCTCQSCPYQLQIQSQQQQHQQQQHMQQQQQQQVLPSQQQFVQQAEQIQHTNGGCIRHHGPGTDDIQNNGNIDHMHNVSCQQLQHCTVTTTPPTNQMFPLHLTQQTSIPPAMISSTPGHQHHQQAPTVHHQQQQQHHQQQLTQMQNNMQQCQQYHTMQPHMYQQQKQLMHHHRGHSQQTQAISTQHDSLTQHHAIYQENLMPQSFSLQHHNHQQQQHHLCREDEAKLQDYSRYANVQSLMNDQASKYQEHVYCNQKPELPPYKSPPSYENFIENRAMYAFDMGGRHTTHLSESKLQRAKDSSYENLRPNRYQEAFTS